MIYFLIYSMNVIHASIIFEELSVDLKCFSTFPRIMEFCEIHPN